MTRQEIDTLTSGQEVWVNIFDKAGNDNWVKGSVCGIFVCADGGKFVHGGKHSVEAFVDNFGYVTLEPETTKFINEFEPIDVSKYDFTSIEGRAKFIHENESSIYTGVNEDGDPVYICLEKDEGMIIKTRHANNPKFWECIEFDKYGYREGVIYEPSV